MAVKKPAVKKPRGRRHTCLRCRRVGYNPEGFSVLQLTPLDPKFKAISGVMCNRCAEDIADYDLHNNVFQPEENDPNEDW